MTAKREKKELNMDFDVNKIDIESMQEEIKNMTELVHQVNARLFFLNELLKVKQKERSK